MPEPPTGIPAHRHDGPVSSSFWDGSGSAIIGSAGSAFVAVAAILLTRKNDRNLMHEQIALTATGECQAFIVSLRHRGDAFISRAGPPDWDAVTALADACDEAADHLYLFIGKVGSRKISAALSDLWQDLPGFATEFRVALRAKDAGAIDSAARDFGTYLTNVSAVLEGYLMPWDRSSQRYPKGTGWIGKMRRGT
jgi:hypothetical protein